MTKQGGWSATGFGSRLRALREKAGFSQKQIAEKAECNQYTVAKLERGLQEPAWPLVLALAKALGVTCEAFIGDAAADVEETRSRGRPPRPSSTEPEEPKPKRPPGRPRKAEGQGEESKRSAGK